MPTDDKQKSTNTPPIIFMEDTLPPMPQAAQQSTVNSQQNEIKTDITNPSPVTATGSSAPSDDVVMPAVVTSGPNTDNLPHKKYAGGKIIATILGLFLLVGGIGAGVYLTGQNQNINEMAKKRGSEDCDGLGSPKARQACNAGSFEEAPDGGRMFVGDPKYDLGNQVSRCQALSMCKDTSCTTEYGSDCEGEDIKIIVTDTASCQDVKAYNSTWVELTTVQMSSLKVGDIVNFCVTGTTTGGIFTKAMFTINGVLQAETTLRRPLPEVESNDFCQSYTIPTGVTSFNVTADIFHAVLGWR